MPSPGWGALTAPVESSSAGGTDVVVNEEPDPLQGVVHGGEPVQELVQEGCGVLDEHGHMHQGHLPILWETQRGTAPRQAVAREWRTRAGQGTRTGT